MNPILSGFYPDPSICRVDDTFYMVTSTFEYFPSVPIFKSKNLINWTQIGHCVTDENYLKLSNSKISGGIFAPTIRYHNGTFYMITTDVSGIGNFFVTATDPAGPWSKPIKVDFKGIDPSLYFEGDNVYCNTTGRDTNNNQGIIMARIDIKTGECLEDKKFLWTGTGGVYPEGAHIYKHGDKYYLLVAEGGTSMGHMETIACSDNIYGPYESNPANPILTHRNFIGQIQGTGHMDIVQAADGNFFAVFLGFRLTESYFHHLGRETFIAPVTWKENEFPIINDNQPIATSIDTSKFPGLPMPVEKSFVDDFSDDKLNFRYNFLRKSSTVRYELNHGLTLYGNGVSIDEISTPAWIGFRQTEFNIEAFFHIKAEMKHTDFCGVTIFYNSTRHFDLCVNNNAVCIKKRFDDIRETTFKQFLDDPDANVQAQAKDLVLYIKADELTYYFGFGDTEQSASENIVATGLTRHLATEAAKITFTGVYLAMFVNGEPESKMTVKEIKYNALNQPTNAQN
ncbi:MAG: hypothetical protein ATN31_08745 [Candidatus Epulonipiscioides saccharophilum]|nr:MAG: hypothetical protein ATN31_08745 [Epulopiscium sp. AS2M-Bin001]